MDKVKKHHVFTFITHQQSPEHEDISPCYRGE